MRTKEEPIRAMPDDLVGECWAIREEHLEAAMIRLSQGHPVPEAAVSRGRVPALVARTGKVAVIPVTGVITPRATAVGWYLGWTSAEGLRAAFDEAMADPTIEGIVFDVFSPGGSVYGVAEVADHIAAARGRKPMVAVANSMAASAAYWIASAADRVLVTPSGEIGSIGVISVHLDRSAAMERQGYRFTLVTAGRYKAEGHEFAPLQDEARAFLQGRVNDYYEMFTKAVARYRATSAVAVQSGYGQGRVVGAREAVAVGLADGVGTIEDAINGMAGALALRAGALGRFRAVQLLEVEAGISSVGIEVRERERRLHLIELTQ
ncbi:MAG: S49 family peptidase [Gemmatimonadales bacterium]|nr:S49 family peptidase [Gemmatimonadales bacterium]MBP9199183.1 S49 family peptidase [Gemmatimonadales bacterium]